LVLTKYRFMRCNGHFDFVKYNYLKTILTIIKAFMVIMWNIWDVTDNAERNEGTNRSTLDWFTHMVIHELLQCVRKVFSFWDNNLLHVFIFHQKKITWIFVMWNIWDVTDNAERNELYKSTPHQNVQWLIFLKSIWRNAISLCEMSITNNQ
jgi:hypothetical protein